MSLLTTTLHGAVLAGPLLLLAATAGGDELRLVATVIQTPDPDGRSRAVFEDGAGVQTALTPGEAVAGCRLLEIAAKTARLGCADGAVTLRLREGLDARRAGGARAASGPRASYEVSLPREEFSFALEDRQRLVSQVSLEPAVDAGRLYGYRIAWLREGGDFHRLGLRDGDVILSLNGVEARDPGTFVQAVNALRGATSFAVGVERAGERIEYSYLLR